MPTFPNQQGTSPQNAVAQIVSSIAMEELALSHILNAEGEKLQYALGTLGDQPPAAPGTAQLVALNNSVKGMVSAVSLSQMFLLGKLSAAISAFEKLSDHTGGGGNTGGGGENPAALPVNTPSGGFTPIVKDKDPMNSDGYYADLFFPDPASPNNKYYHDGSIHLEDVITDNNFTGVTAAAVDPKYKNFIRIDTDHDNKPSIMYNYVPSADEWKQWAAQHQNSDITIPVQVVLTRGAQTATVTINMIYPGCLVTMPPAHKGGGAR